MHYFYVVSLIVCAIKMLFIVTGTSFVCKEATRLVSLDINISKLLNSSKKDDGDSLLAGLTKYWVKLKHLDQLVRSNKTYYGDSAFYVMQRGINNFALGDFNITELVETFEWDESKLRHFNETMRNIQRLGMFFTFHCKDLIYTNLDLDSGSN